MVSYLTKKSKGGCPWTQAQPKSRTFDSETGRARGCRLAQDHEAVPGDMGERQVWFIREFSPHIAWQKEGHTACLQQRKWGGAG